MPTERYADIYLMASLLRYAVKLIPVEHIRRLLEKQILPVINNYLFVESAPPPSAELEIGYELLNLKTLA
jgi:hypothetical protein